MRSDVRTKFKDKAGKAIHIGDIVEHRLDNHQSSKNAGPKRMRVIKPYKKVCLIGESETDTKYGGLKLDDTLARYLVVIDCDHMWLLKDAK